jgi:DNA-binding FadR family transcriptional regulator
VIAVDILSGRLPEGSSLPPDVELMTKFGVSRTVLREAIRVLTSKGLVEAKARVGTKVRERYRWYLFDPDVLLWQAEAGLDRQFVAHLGEMRLILEPEAAALAAQRGSRADVEHLVALADRMATKDIPAEAFAKADLDFHFAVSACADNPFLTAVNALIEVSLTASLRRSWPGDVPGGTARSAEAHRQIAVAIRAGDCDGAKAAMRRVIIEGMTRSLGKE